MSTQRKDVEPENLLSILGLAFGLGLIHALDTDHVVAVSTLASRPGSLSKRPWRYGLHWALGHGGTALLLGVAVLVAGIKIPEPFSGTAETLVGLVMIGMGAMLIYRLSVSVDINSIRAGDPRLVAHAGQHGATAVGALHGMAGSASLLALIPALTSGSIWLGMSYLVLFNIGVLCAMLLCATALGLLFKRLSRAGNRILCVSRFAIAGAAVIVGTYLVQSTL